MEQHQDPNTMQQLQLLKQPAFLVEEGQITRVNSAASACLLQPGQRFTDLLLTGAEEYESFSQGRLFVTLSLSGIQRDACVTRIDGVDWVTVEQSQSQQKLQVLTLAATALREPINVLTNLAEQFFPVAAGEDDALQNQAAQMNRRLYQLLRIVGNMSYATDYASPGCMETIEICSFLEEILEKTVALYDNLRVRVTYDLPKGAILTQVNTERLERAVFNQLSNAIKYAVEDSQVRFRLVQKNQRLYISVSNTPSNPDAWEHIYNRFPREPGLLDPRDGIGLGMLLMQHVAAIHQGAALAEQIGEEIRITLTLPVRHSGYTQTRSPILSFDYAGERDHCLIELSDVLPASVYKPDNLK